MSTSLNISELLNLVGLSTGVVLYAMLLAMVMRAGRTAGRRPRVDPLLLLTSVLGLVWNLCALAVYELPKVGFEGPFPFLAAVGFGALGFLPAVVVHSVLRREHQRVHGAPIRVLVAIAYAVGVVAFLLHLRSAWSGAQVPSAVGMRLLTSTFVALIVPLAAMTRGQPGARRALWAAALATFAVSALHLSQLHRGDAAWPVELVGHHASLPLAFAILYQDYPFALADLFLKRALALFALIAIPFAAIVTFGVKSAAFAAFVRVEPGQVAILVTLWLATAWFYPAMRRATAWFVDTIVLHRPDYGSLRAAVARSVQRDDDVPAMLTSVCALLTPALSARSVTWQPWPKRHEDEALGEAVLTGSDASALVESLAHRGASAGIDPPVAAAVRLSTSDTPAFVISIGQLTGGRRLLSDDLDTLEAIAVIVARRIDAIRLTGERHAREIREREMQRLTTEAELRALRAQINPHFLFNALTTIGYLIQTAPPRALETLLRLTALLRGVLRSEGEFTTLGRELEIIESYLDIERARFEHRLGATIDVPSKLRTIRLPPLVLQPIVENAVKHGIARKQAGGEITIRASIAGQGSSARCLAIRVHDTGAGATAEALRIGRASGVGLRNVERRLNHQYGSLASLSIESSPAAGTLVEIRVPLDHTVVAAHDERAVAT